VKPEDPEAGHTLAGAGFADDAERLPPLDGERQPIDGLDETVVSGEMDLQVLDVDERGRRTRDRLDVGRRWLRLAGSW
jgi:hypothetical protein